MTKYKNLIALPITLLGLICAHGMKYATPANAATNQTGTKGAQIYCYMRNSGNGHEVSWQSAYEVMKRQKEGLFKTSPKHGAVMIIEAVVAEPLTFEGCGNYLGDLFGNSSTNLNGQMIKPNSKNKSKQSNIDRYSY